MCLLMSLLRTFILVGNIHITYILKKSVEIITKYKKTLLVTQVIIIDFFLFFIIDIFF